jgi:hypothetical protein
MDNECGAISGVRVGRKAEVIGEYVIQFRFLRPQIPPGLPGLELASKRWETNF